MADEKPTQYSLELTVNGHNVEIVLIGRHYLEKHGSYLNDQIILDLVMALDGGDFPPDSITNGLEYYAADIEWGEPAKIYRLIWLFEGAKLEILGVVSVYRRKTRKK
ncbi:MAG: hypothetical protein H6626_04225 [Pseudobdellovibrionaceae bacterium]|nr:hypothetical protein [Bdellovibrionales bacterium]USN48304.1 MAG: hypothetical protein H6626_04225 [Pseudobdellovibrionaceae bacterium]